MNTNTNNTNNNNNNNTTYTHTDIHRQRGPNKITANEGHRAETTGADEEGREPQPKKAAKEKKRPHSEKVREGNSESSRDS